MSPKKIDRIQKQREMLRAALKVFSHQGIHDFKISDIAAAAGIGKGTVYEFFSSKEEVIEKSFMLFLEDYRLFVGRRLEAIGDPVEKIKSLVQSSCDFFVEDRTRLNLIFDLWASGVPHRQGKIIYGDLSTVYGEMLDWLADIIKNGVNQGLFCDLDPRFASSFILAMLDGIMFQAILGLVDISDKSLPGKISRAILEGLKK